MTQAEARRRDLPQGLPPGQQASRAASWSTSRKPEAKHGRGSNQALMQQLTQLYHKAHLGADSAFLFLSLRFSASPANCS